MLKVEAVRKILETTFAMPVAESDAQIILDRFNDILQSENAAEHSVQQTQASRDTGEGWGPTGNRPPGTEARLE